MTGGTWWEKLSKRGGRGRIETKTAVRESRIGLKDVLDVPYIKQFVCARVYDCVSE